MQAQQQDPVAVQNILALQKKEFEIKFDLGCSQYDPVETIGTGAYGVVCSAVHRLTKQKVAIKKIPDIFSQDTIAKRTLREVRILKHFKHDNVISIREILKPTESLDKFRDIYIVLDLMESDMHRVIHSKQDLSDEHIRYFLYQILRGLKYIHSANVIHRDLKPSNLLVNENCDLKIGDFGMARGVSSNPDEYNHMLTQYVATRWYRAPEIMMATLAYSGAVDMWSVGCILAEMLGRRQLFPGHDYVDQLKLIIGIVGSPSKDFLNLITSQNIRNFVNSLGYKKPESFRKLYPKAKNKAITLLETMLCLDPTKRLSVENSLKHPYFSTYHDPDDEPICIPTFDFSIESKDLTSSELKEGIIKEIMDYHKPKSKPQLTFDFRPVPKSEQLKTPSPKVLKPGVQPEHTRVNKETCDQIAAQIRARQFAESKADAPKEPPKQTIKTHTLQPSENDIEMLSAKLSATKVDDAVEKTRMEKNDEARDVHMTQDAPPAEEPKPVNAKEALKMALLNARLSKQKGVEKKRPITALQRQRENEEKKKKKLLKAKEKKKKQKEKESPMKLTTDDLQMLERWKTMQAKPEAPNKVQTATSGSSDPLSVTMQPQGFPTTTQTPVYTGPTFSTNAEQSTNGVLANGTIPAAISKAPPSYSEATFGQNTTPEISFASLNSRAASRQQPEETFAGFDLQPKEPFASYSEGVKHLSPSDLLFGTNPMLGSNPTQPSLPLAAATTSQVPQFPPPVFMQSSSSNPDPQTMQPQASTFRDDKAIAGAAMPLPSDSTVTAALQELTSGTSGPAAEIPPPSSAIPADFLSYLNKMSKVKADDLTLVHTPKGTGAGYGVGLDLDSILADSQPSGETRLDSAPLSASLIQDWMDMTGNLDTKDLENLELEIGLPMGFNDLV